MVQVRFLVAVKLYSFPNSTSAGKSSIFRCLGALWSVVEGTITKPGGTGDGLHDKVFYLPQKPYNVIGDLRAQLTYPAVSVGVALSDTQLRDLLKLVDLEYLYDQRSDTNVNWEQTLSLGETQRLAMARLFYHQPMFAILDECTSAVSQLMERNLYDICQDRGITCITISHRPALIAYHDLKLELDGNGGYNLETISHSEVSSSKALTPSASSPQLQTAAKKEDDGAGGAAAATTICHVLASADDPQLQFPPLTSPIELAREHRLPRFARFLKLLRLLVPSLTDDAAKWLFGLVGDRWWWW